jgi:hypothetical protein
VFKVTIQFVVNGYEEAEGAFATLIEHARESTGPPYSKQIYCPDTSEEASIVVEDINNEEDIPDWCIKEHVWILN